MSAEHPILARFAQLQDQLRAFLEDPHARLLVWRARPDEQPLLQGFLEGEVEAPELGLHPPNVVVLTPAFRDPRAHAAALVRALHAHDEPEAGRSGEPPCAERGDIAPLLVALAAVDATETAAESCLMLWLAPDDVDDPAAYRRWLGRLVREAPAWLRLVVVELCDDDTCGALAHESPERVRVQACGLDMPEALRALARHADDGGEGGHYRQLFLRLSDAIARRDVACAERVAERARALALQAGWPSLAVAVQMMLAAGHASFDDRLSALRAYVEAERLADVTERVEQADGVERSLRCGGRLRLTARLGQAAQLLAQQAYRKAAEHYAACAQLAGELVDPRLQLDAHRLAASCLALLDAHADAWHHGLAGLAVAEAMDAALRATSTLPFLAAQLLRMQEGARNGAPESSIDARLTALLGSGWRTRLPEVTGSQAFGVRAQASSPPRAGYAMTKRTG